MNLSVHNFYLYVNQDYSFSLKIGKFVYEKYIRINATLHLSRLLEKNMNLEQACNALFKNINLKHALLYPSKIRTNRNFSLQNIDL